MFKDNKKNAKFNIQGRILISSFMISSSFMTFVIFLLSSVCSIYLLVINTEFSESIGVFDSKYILGTVCAFAVAVNIVLLLLHVYYKLRKDLYFYYYDTDNIRISVNTVCKAFCVYSLKFIIKILCLMFFISPFSAVAGFIILLLKSGISQFSLITFILVDIFLLFIGIYSDIVYIQKYHLLPLVLFENADKSICEIFKLSAKKMNGICKNLLNLKISNFPKKILCLFVIPAIYYLPYCNAVEADFVLQKENPYMRRRAYTEKPIVFYFKEIKEN